MVQIFIFGLEGDLGVTLCPGSLLHLCSGAVALLSVVTVIAVDVAVASVVTLLGRVLIELGALRSPFSQIWRKISVRIELSGVLESRGMICSALSSLLLGSSHGGPREDSTHRHFWSSCFSSTSASTTTYWLAFCSISSIVAGGRSTSDQKKREGLIPIINAWMTNDGCASGMTLISFIKRARYGSRGSSSFCLNPRRDAVVGFDGALARKLSSNSLAS
ncbi:hypothetical protein BHM03_00047993 [Ensete ventricosum]|nr:hypothetical protein BHM03_00047993 [Ensete ventricosum]